MRCRDVGRLVRRRPNATTTRGLLARRRWAATGTARRCGDAAATTFGRRDEAERQPSWRDAAATTPQPMPGQKNCCADLRSPIE